MRRSERFELPAPEELARRRRDLMSQREMAEVLDVDPSHVSRFERGLGGMRYDRIRRYAHVLNLRAAASDLHRYLVERIQDRGPLPELRTTDRLDQALDALTSHGVGQLPVQDASGEHLGVLTEVAVCEALAAREPEGALRTRVGELPIEPLDTIRPGDTVTRAAALLASHWLVRVVGEDGGTLGYATRGDLFPLVLGHGSV